MIELSDKFQLDISSNTYSIQPLIIIDEDNSPIYISTHKQSFNIDEENSVYWEDYNLNISNITESIDLKTRNFKTNKVDFSLTNYKVNERRISDDIAQYSLINKYVDIYYKTQSCRTLEDCSLVYKGIIKSVKHDSKTIRITLEDLTEDKLNREVPIANLGYTDKVFNKKYLNKEIPITYGDAFKAPAVLYLNGEGTHSLYAITDDVFDSERNISLGAHSGTKQKARQFTTAPNSLYLYKEEYFQVFQQFKHKALGNNANGEWDWNSDYQYYYSSGGVVFPRLFAGGLPENPPAFNELQTFIIRNPVQMMLASNIPDNSYGAFYLQDDVLDIETPALAIDNPDYQFLSSNYNVEVPYGTDPYSTFAAIPPNDGTGAVEFEGKLLVNNFFAHRVDDDDSIGCWLPRRDDDVTENENWDTYQFKIFQFLNFNMDKINRLGSEGVDDIDDVIYKVSYVQLPSFWDIMYRINKVWVCGKPMNTWSQHDFFTYNGVNQSERDHITDWKNNGAIDSECPINWMSVNGQYAQASCQAYPQMCDRFKNHWNSSSVCNDAIDWGSYDGDNDGGFANSNGGMKYYPQPTVFRILPALGFIYEDFTNFCVTQMTSQMNGAGHPTNQHYETNGSTPSSLEGYNDGAAVHFNVLFNKPEPYTGNQYYTGVVEDGSAVFAQIGSARAKLADPWHPGWEHWDDFGGFSGASGALFLPEEIPTYTPVDRIARYRGTDANAVSWMAAIGYRCLWNGVEPDQFYGQNMSPHAQGRNDHKFFGLTNNQGGTLSGYGCWATDAGGSPPQVGTNPITDQELYQKGRPERCWAIITHENLDGTDEVGLQGDDYDPDFQTVLDPRPDLRIPIGTILPCLHMTNTRGGGEWKDSDHATFGSIGEEEYVSDFIKLYDHDEDENLADTRFGVAFQLDDIDESDVIKCDTFFSGRIAVEFDDSGTSNGTSAHFQLWLKTAQIEDQAQDADAVITGDSLISIDLDAVHSGAHTHMWSVAEQDESPPYGTDNHFESWDVEWIQEDNWTEPNSYNGFALHYLVHSSGEGIDGGYAHLKTKIYDASILQVIQFENAFDSDLYIEKSGRENTDEDIIEIEGEDVYKYTGNNSLLIESPQDILYHFVEKELNMEDFVDEESLNLAREENTSLQYAFSINKTTKAKDFIRDFVKSTKIFPIFKSTSKFGFSVIKSLYSESDVTTTVKSKDIISYGFSRTPISDIYTIVNVKYAYDYAKDNFSKQTGYVDGYDLFGNVDLGYRENGYSYDYLKLEREGNVLEFESKYIRDDVTALALRDYIYLWNCNQHNIFELTLPNKYINLEAGDIIRFDKLIENVKCYGEDYTQHETRNSQLIYPYFIIDYISKKANNIKLKCTQLHELERKFLCSNGSITRSNSVNEDLYVISEDVDELVSFLSGANKYFTRDQRRVSDLSNDGYIYEDDLDMLEDMFNVGSMLDTGGLNLDKPVNVSEIIKLISSELGKNEIDEESLTIPDSDENENVNTEDILALINQINNSQ